MMCNDAAIFSEYEVDGFKMLLEGFESGAKETPFLTISVKDYLWGYPSVLKTMDNLQKCQEESWSEEEDDWADTWDDPCEDFLNDENKPNMGVFWGRNGTALDLRKINTGRDALIQCRMIYTNVSLYVLQVYQKIRCCQFSYF